MQRILLLITLGLLFIVGFGQQYEYRIAKQCDKVSDIGIKVFDYERIGIKLTGTIGFDSATRWLIEKYTDLGYVPTIDTFRVSGNESYNVIVEKPGSQPDKWIIVGAHFDSVDDSYGANDNGTGVIATLEIAELIKNIDTKVGVRIINFGAEEQGYLGSQHYVSNTLMDKQNIQLMLNLDQLGGTKGADNSAIECERDQDNFPPENNSLSHLKTDTMARLISLYTSLDPVIGEAERSDYEPFEDEGMTIMGLYQASDYPYYHTSRDITSNMDFYATRQVIKGALATTLYFARIDIVVGVDEIGIDEKSLYPNPASNLVYINSPVKVKVRLFSTTGAILRDEILSSGQPIDVNYLDKGVYTVSISSLDGKKNVHHKLIIAR